MGEGQRDGAGQRNGETRWELGREWRKETPGEERTQGQGVGDAGQGQGVARNTVVSNRTEGQRAEEGRKKDRESERHRLGEEVGQREKDGRKQEGQREGRGRDREQETWKRSKRSAERPGL